MTLSWNGLFLVLLCGATSLHGYVRESYDGQALKRTSNVGFSLEATAKAGLQNAAGKTIITPESDPAAAIQAAMNTWNTVPGGNLNLYLSTVPAKAAPASDGRNIITFDDTAANRSIVGSAIAVTYFYFLPSQSAIIDSDIVFNPDLTFATTPTLGAYDLQSIATHELGHAIGADHTPFTSAAMFPYCGLEDTSGRFLSKDDRAFVNVAFAPGSPLGGIRGSITTPSGGFPASALVLIINRDTGVVAAPYSEGSAYSNGGLPPGDYVVLAFPVAPYLAGSDNTDFDTPDWQPTFYGGATPQAVSVSAGSFTQADISVPDGPARVHFDFGFLENSSTGYADRVPSGGAASVTLFGTGLSQDMKAEDIDIYGGGATIRTDSLKVTMYDDSTGDGKLSFVLDIPPRADWVDAAIVVRAGDFAAVYSDVRFGPAQPAYMPSGVVNAATFESGPLAPGEIISIFGNQMGPEQGVMASLQPGDTLPTTLGDTTLKINDVPVPLLYVSSRQINAQVPFEIAGLPSARVRLHRGSADLEGILPVAAASPGVFGFWDQPAIMNEDGSLNDYSKPAAKGRPVIVYATGQGIVDPPLATGKIAPAGPLCHAPAVTAKIDDAQAVVDFSGLAPGFVGLWQVNVVVPENVAAGFVPLVLTVNGSFTSDPVYFYVQ
jgi:uncharacterized protein (TIGR03437 family)